MLFRSRAKELQVRLKEAKEQAPAGGMLVRGIYYPGGEMVPSKDYEISQREKYAKGDYAGALKAEADHKERLKYAANDYGPSAEEIKRENEAQAKNWPPPPESIPDSPNPPGTRMMPGRGSTRPQTITPPPSPTPRPPTQYPFQPQAPRQAPSPAPVSRVPPAEQNAPPVATPPASPRGNQLAPSPGNLRDRAREAVGLPSRPRPQEPTFTPDERKELSEYYRQRPWEDPTRANAGSSDARAWGDVNARLRKGIAEQNRDMAENRLNQRLAARRKILQEGANRLGKPVIPPAENPHEREGLPVPPPPSPFGRYPDLTRPPAQRRPSAKPDEGPVVDPAYIPPDRDKPIGPLSGREPEPSTNNVPGYGPVGTQNEVNTERQNWRDYLRTLDPQKARQMEEDTRRLDRSRDHKLAEWRLKQRNRPSVWSDALRAIFPSFRALPNR